MKKISLALLLGVAIGLPFIVRVKDFLIPYPLDMVFPTNGGYVYDFMLYYKGLWFNLFTFMLVVMRIRHLGKEWFRQWRVLAILMLGYMGCVVLSFISADYKTLAFVGAPNSYESILVLLSYGGIFLVGLYYFQEDTYTQAIWKGMNVLFIGLGGMGIVEFFYKSVLEMPWAQYLILPPSQWENIGQIVNQGFQKQISLTLYNPNYAALFLLMLLPIAIIKVKESKGKKRLYAVGILGIVVMSFLFTRSTAALYAAIICLGMMTLIYFKDICQARRVVGSILGVLIAIILVIDFCNGNILSRTFLGDYSTKTQEKPYAVERLVLDYNRLWIENDQVKWYIETTYPVQAERIICQVETADEPLTKQVQDDQITFQEEGFGQVSITCEEEGFALDLGYDEPVYFQVEASGKLHAVGPNGYRLGKIHEESGIGFKDYQHLATGRGYIWRKSIPVLQTAGVLGTGPDTAALYIPQNDFAGKLTYHGRVSLAIDKPHNLYLQIAIQTGILSLLCIVGVFVYTLYKGIRLLILNPRSRKSRYYDQAVALFVGAIGYMICGLAYDSSLATAPLFWLLLSMTSVWLHKIQREIER